MASNPQVLELLEEILNSEKTPEEVCRHCPELQSEVERRWEEFQRIDLQVRTLLPGLDSSPGGDRTATSANAAAPPAVFGRYKVHSSLGAGAFGTVYLGEDTQLDRYVAIKVLRVGTTAKGDDSEPALREARRLAQLRHPGIVAVHDAGVQGEQLYIVSDYLDGSDLGRWMQDQRPQWPQAAAIAAAIADALSHAHARLIVHRDVKPANILVTTDGAPVLVDFGLALDETLAGGCAKGIVAGTPSYMSPEQAAGAAHRLDGRTDIYSLGVVLYEMLTGRVPFRAANPHELLRQVRDDLPQPPRQLVGDIPAELEIVCLKALAKRQEDRHSTAGDFAEDLRRVLQNHATSSSSLATSPGTVTRMARLQTQWPTGISAAELPLESTGPQLDGRFSPLSTPIERHTVGREAEIVELDRAFKMAAAGQGLIVCVTGEPGIGKSTLVDDFLSQLAAVGRPCTLARGRCSERLAGTEAYLPFLEALESLLRGAEREEIARVMKRTAPNWYVLVAPLADEDSTLVRVLAESKAASQERLKRELGTFVQEVSQLRPLVLFIDDLHWADASTVDLIAYLGGKCAGIRLLLVFTYRPTDLVVNKNPFGPVKLDLQARGICRELALEFLPREDLDRYLALEFPEHGFPVEFADLVHARTEGSPLFMADLLRYLQYRQVLTQDDGRWTLRGSIPDLLKELPESVRGMIQRKIDQLNEDDRRLLVAASVQGYEFDSAVVARVLELDAADVEERLDELDRVHVFVRMVSEQEFPGRTLTVRYRFVHVLYQNTLYTSLQPTRRASLSAAVAESLLEYHGEKSADIAADLALLFETARDFSQAADYFLIAARNAAHLFANQEAVVLARRGLAVLSSLPNSPERDRQELALQITLGPALFTTQDWTAPEVEIAYTRAQVLCRELGESPDVFPAMWGLFLYHIARGQIQAGLDLGEQMLGLAERAQDAALLLQAHHALGPTYGLVGDWTSAQRHFDQAIARYDRREHGEHAFLYGGHDPCVCCLSFAAKSLWMLGYPDQALQKGNDALALARQLGHPTSLAHTQLSVAILHQFRRDATETLKLADDLRALAADQGLLFYMAGGLVLQGWAMVEQGLIEEGIAQIRQGFDAGGATRAHWRPYMLTLLAETYGKAENFEEGLTVLAEALAVDRQSGIHMYEPEIHRLKGEFLLALEPEKQADAESEFHQAAAIARHHNATSLELRATTSLARIWKCQGRGQEAQAALAAIYGLYSEGLTTPDLVDAAAQLSRLR